MKAVRRFLLAAVLFLSACSRSESVTVSFQEASGSKPVGSFTSEVVSTNASRELGLMYRKELGERQGMLFVFPNESERTFWMKNTYLELDMVFINKEKKVVSITERAVPLTETPRSSKGPAQYVLEIRGGTSRAVGLHPGMTMVVEGELPAGTY